MKPQENVWANAYANFALAARWPIIIVLLLITIAGAIYIPNLDIRNDPDTLLPPSNRYVATNSYAEKNFGMGNIMVLALKVKEGDVWQPWLINTVQEIHNKLVALPESRPENFIDIASQKIKYMGTDENGLVFKRLIPTEGISDDPEKAKEQLAFLREGVKTNPVMAPMLVSMWDKDGNRCAYEDYDKDTCIAKAIYIIGDYTDDVKAIYLPWVRQVRALMDEYGNDPRYELLVAGEPYFLAWMLADLVDLVAVHALDRDRHRRVVARVPQLARRHHAADRCRHDHCDDARHHGFHGVQADHDDGADADAVTGSRYRPLGTGDAPLHAGERPYRRRAAGGA